MTRLRTGFLSDQSVLDRCPEENSIPFNKMNLAARSGAKISFPQKAGFMYQNLPIPHAQKESLINEFVLRSQKQLPLSIPAMEYSTVSLDKVGALTNQNQTGGDVSKDIYDNLLNQAMLYKTNLNQSRQQLGQTQNQLQVANYRTAFLQITKPDQVTVLNRFIGDMDRDQQLKIFNAFGVSKKEELAPRIKNMSKTMMTQLTMGAIENLINDDPNQNIPLDDYFSESALVSGASNVPSSPSLS